MNYSVNVSSLSNLHSLTLLLTSKFTFQNWLLLLTCPVTIDLLLLAPKLNFRSLYGRKIIASSTNSLFWAHPSMQLLHSPKSSLHATQRLKAQFIDALTHSLIRSAPASSVTDSPVYKVVQKYTIIGKPFVRVLIHLFGDLI